MHLQIALYSSHVGAGCERLRDFAGAFHQNRINDVERTMLEPMFTQPTQNRALRLTLIPQGIVNVAALFSLCPHRGRRAEVGLVSEHNKKFSLTAIGGVLDHPRRDFVRRCSPARRPTLADGARGADHREHSYRGCDKQ